MNLLQLVLKQMRQRALSTWLTLLSIVLGVSLAIAIMIIQREGENLFAQSNFGYEVLVGPPKGSPLQLVLNTVYQLDASAGNVPYKVYEDLLKDRFNVKIAVPVAVGDSFKGLRIIGTTPKLFGVNEAGEALPVESVMEYQIGKRYELANGKVFAANRFEALVGSDVQRLVGLKQGDEFKATHGMPAPGAQADEPTGALDATNAQQVLELIRKLCEEVKASLLLVSHDSAITAQFGRVASLSELNRVSEFKGASAS